MTAAGIVLLVALATALSVVSFLIVWHLTPSQVKCPAMPKIPLLQRHLAFEHCVLYTDHKIS